MSLYPRKFLNYWCVLGTPSMSLKIQDKALVQSKSGIYISIFLAKITLYPDNPTNKSLCIWSTWLLYSTFSVCFDSYISP